MSTASPVEFKELVRSRTDIVALIGESVRLITQRGGRMHVGLCPFHDDHNPSMQVNPDRQSYRCWVCNEGGDCFSFVMKHENVSFMEALELLAQRANLELPKFARQPGESPSEKAPLFDILQWADQQFHDYLKHSQPAGRARDYLSGRGFTPETIAQFRIGYHPEPSEWLLERAAGRFRPEQLEAARLIKNSDYGTGYYGEFRDRVVFPICDERGRTVAFGGRILPDSRLPQNAKYYNSRESAVFPKSRLVYGLNWARDAIKDAGFAVVVEGYADCVKLHQAGFGNTLATLGTALTETQVSVMKRFTSRIVLLYDGDDAGVRAAKRAVSLFLAQDLELRVLVLPDQLDPDEYIEAHGPTALRQQLESAPEAWEFYYRQLVAQHGLDSTHARLEVLNGMLELLSVSLQLEGSVKEGLLLATLPRRLGMQESQVRQRLTDLRRERQKAAHRKVSATGAGGEAAAERRKADVLSLQRSARGDDLLECEFLQYLFTAPHTMEMFRAEIGPDDFRHDLLRELWTVLTDLAEEGEEPTFERLLTRIDCPDLKSLAVWIDERARARSGMGQSAQDEHPDNVPGFVTELVTRMKFRRERGPYQRLSRNFAENQSNSAGLTESAKSFLAHLTRFHEQRAIPK